MTDRADSSAPRVKDTASMVRGMSPRAVPGRWVFRTLNVPVPPENALCSFREEEGLSVIVPAGEGEALVMRMITLDVHSALDGFGLTAAVAGALAVREIPCNVVAAHHHDHLFVPEERADEALVVLEALAAGV